MGCRPVAPWEEGAKMPPLQPMVVVPQQSYGFLGLQLSCAGKVPAVTL